MADIERLDERALADVALVVEALATLAGHPADLETPRDRRAWELISGLAEDLDTAPSDLLCLEPYLRS